jgi:DNA-binding MarR family transcriptional regulator
VEFESAIANRDLPGHVCDADAVERETMAKADRTATMSRLHSAARLARTALAARLLEHGFYADREDGQTPGTLADRLGVRPPTITKTINRLQAQGFLEKRNSIFDARQAHIFLTEAGRDLIVSIEKSVKKTEKQALKGLDKKEQKTLAKLLARIEANLTNEEIVFIDDEPETEAETKPDAKNAAGTDAEPATASKVEA